MSYETSEQDNIIREHPSDDEECVQCPDGTVTKGVASTSIDDCIQGITKHCSLHFTYLVRTRSIILD